MQKNKTLRFWDDFYRQEEESQSKGTEWILKPTQSILRTISNKFELDVHVKNGSEEKTEKTGGSRSLALLEIGCGNSKFSLQLWHYLHNIFNGDGSMNERMREVTVSVVATDVSPICIQQNVERDGEFIKEVSSNVLSPGSFCYETLNILEEPDESEKGKYAIILDKGCFDTFLFRSEKTKSGQHSPLVQKLLNNVHALLASGGKYIIFSPRKKMNSLRDFNGFTSVQRTKLESKNTIIGALDGKSENNEVVYMHICSKNDKYTDGDKSFRNQIKIPTDDEKCKICGIKFIDFRRGEAMSGKGVAYWGRRWQGHIKHCK